MQRLVNFQNGITRLFLHLKESKRYANEAETFLFWVVISLELPTLAQDDVIN